MVFHSGYLKHCYLCELDFTIELHKLTFVYMIYESSTQFKFKIIIQLYGVQNVKRDINIFLLRIIK